MNFLTHWFKKRLPLANTQNCFPLFSILPNSLLYRSPVGLMQIFQLIDSHCFEFFFFSQIILFKFQAVVNLPNFVQSPLE